MMMVAMKAIVRKATFFHLTKYDDDDNDHGDYDDDNVNANADLCQGGSLPFPPYRPTQGSKYHSSTNHQQNGTLNHINVNFNI